MNIGDIVRIEDYAEAINWCNENKAKLEEIEPIIEEIEIPENSFVDDDGDYIIIAESHTEQKEVRQFKIIEIPQPSEENIKQARINELKAKLTDTDYVVIKIAEGEATQEEYAEVLAQRKVWRAEINELEIMEQ